MSPPTPASVPPELVPDDPDVPPDVPPELELVKPDVPPEVPLVPPVPLDEKPLDEKPLDEKPLDVSSPLVLPDELLPELEVLPDDDWPEEDAFSFAYSMSSFPTIALQPKMQTTNTIPATAPVQRGSMTMTL